MNAATKSPATLGIRPVRFWTSRTETTGFWNNPCSRVIADMALFPICEMDSPSIRCLRARMLCRVVAALSAVKDVISNLTCGGALTASLGGCIIPRFVGRLLLGEGVERVEIHCRPCCMGSEIYTDHSPRQPRVCTGSQVWGGGGFVGFRKDGMLGD